MASPADIPPPRNPDDLGLGPVVMGITWTFTALASISTTLRLYTRKRISPHLAIEDWLMAIAMLVQILAETFLTIAFRYGMGKHQYDLYVDQIVPMYKYEPRVGHLCPHLNLHLPCAIDPAIISNLMYTGQSVYALADLTFVIVPVVIVWKLNMTLSRRLGLISLISFSLVTCAMSIIKGVSAHNQQTGPDPGYPASLSLLWAILEQGCVILLGNLIPLRALLKIEIPILNSIASSMATLLGRSSRSTKKPSTLSETPGYRNGAYHDIEMNTHRLGNESNAVWRSVKGYGSHKSDSVKSMIPDDQVKRTDAFTVDYDSGTSPKPRENSLVGHAR
ncbi:hypothetical protein F4806DRAFT_504126 [Annulohypoxylon nitens]|nr:hypothetical protein F4806DRAFT_504126 [Annulohypoxylon nitens]